MSEAARQTGGPADRATLRIGGFEQGRRQPGAADPRPAGLPATPPDRLLCNRCGFPVISRAWGCKNPCANCGTVYPLGDCSD